MQRDLEKIVTFSEYWLSKAAEGRIPAFGDLLPEEIFRALPNLVVWTLVDGGADFHCRICGEDLNRNYGWNPTGSLLNDIIRNNPSVAAFRDNFRLCLSQAAPITVIDKFIGHFGTAKRTIGIVAPLANGTGEICELVCCSIYLSNGDSERAEATLTSLFPRADSNL
ncbi:MAG: hypothetical protein RH942_04760 [Kiloniellaceae bacterium]